MLKTCISLIEYFQQPAAPHSPVNLVKTTHTNQHTSSGSHRWCNGRERLAVMDVKFAWIDRTLSLRAQIPLRLENRSTHEVDCHIENASRDAVACTRSWGYSQHQRLCDNCI